MPNRRLLCVLVSIAACLAAARDCRAQAWVPEQGDGAISFSYQRIDNTGHRLTDGAFVDAGHSLDMSLYLEGEYAITNRFTVTAGLPFVFTKYTDPNGPPPPIPYLPWEQCHCWQMGFQDFEFSGRYNLVSGRFAFTPVVAAVVPSQNYEYRGETALGRDLKELRIGFDVGQRLDRISRNLSVQGHYTYAFVERVLNIPDNRSNGSIEGVYVVKKRLALRGFSGWQVTHGGLQLGSMPPAALVFPGEVDTPELLAEHDRLLRDDNWRAGGGLAYSFNKVDVFANYIAYLSGTDTHAGRVVTVGFSVPFHTGRAHR